MIVAPPREKYDPMRSVGPTRATSTRDLARALRRIGVLRGIAAFAVGAFVFFQEPSAPAVARASAAYWIVDGLVVLWASRFADALALGRMVFLIRGTIAIAAGLIVLGLPLGMVFGPWQPGHGVLFILLAPVMLTVVGFQIGAGAFDVLICVAIRRRIAGEWSWGLGGAFSAALAVVAASTFAAPAIVAARLLSIGAVVAGLVFVVGAVTRGDSGTVSVLPARPRKH